MRLARWSLAFTLMVVTLSAGHAHAWGWEAHRWINAAAVDILPADMQAMVEQERDALAAHAPDPDLWKSDSTESYGHYIDLELGDADGPPYAAIPRDYDAALVKYGADSLRRMGILPWRIENYYDRLVNSMREPTDSTWVIMAAIGHYCSDATMPMHTTLYYDGQTTGQRGIHFRFEWWMLEAHADDIHLCPIAPFLVTDPLDVAWPVIRDSHAHIDTLLGADAGIRATFRPPIPNPEDRHGRGRDAEFDGRLYDRLGEIAVRRMEMAAQFAAGVWYAAWIEAGRPDLSTVPSPPPPPSAE